MSTSPPHPVSVKISYWIPEQDKDRGDEPTETRILDASNVEIVRIGLPEHVEPVKVRAVLQSVRGVDFYTTSFHNGADVGGRSVRMGTTFNHFAYSSLNHQFVLARFCLN